MAPPQVRDLQALIAEQTASLTPQYQLIDESINANEQSGQAQVAGLDATKRKAFGQIEQAASNKGMYFSGFSPAEQAEYTASSYLPELAKLQGTIAGARNSLLGKKADLGKSAFDAATNIREGDIQTLRAWEKMTAEQQFNASEAEKQRVFQAQQNEKDRQLQASEGAKGRAASAASSAGPSNQELFASELAKSTGKDGKVSPGTYNALKQQWVASGYGDYKSFHDKFWKFANDSHWWDYR